MNIRNKKRFWVFLIVGLCFGLCACSSLDSNPYKEKSNILYETNEDGVSVEVSILSDQVLNISIFNQSLKYCLVGEAYAIEYKFDGEWYVVPLKPNTCFSAIAYFIDPGEERTFTVEIKNYFDSMPSGHYRIIKEIFLHDDLDEFTNEKNKHILVAEFDI